MKLSEQVKPVSYFKANAAEMLRSVGEGGAPYIITQNGEAKAVLMDIDSYEETQETLALLKILALGTRQIEENDVYPADEVFDRLRDGLREK
ncbi:type II toxin-antitoxin system Phd/YefM family antitoxin [bacterium]|nr:type II toxin-antitoxin system Phd/YefM family antitoxin [bacterium]